MKYILNDNLSKESLIEFGFTNHNKNYLYYQKTLYMKDYYDVVTLCITIKLDDDWMLTNELELMVLDELFLQPYLPFYDEKAIYSQEVLDIVKENFEKEMNLLVKSGIISIKEKDKVKSLN